MIDKESLARAALASLGESGSTAASEFFDNAPSKFRAHWLKMVDAILADIAVQEHAVVPREPTEAMRAANSKATKQFLQDGGALVTADGLYHVPGLATLTIAQWQAMIAATDNDGE